MLVPSKEDDDNCHLCGRRGLTRVQFVLGSGRLKLALSRVRRLLTVHLRTAGRDYTRMGSVARTGLGAVSRGVTRLAGVHATLGGVGSTYYNRVSSSTSRYSVLSTLTRLRRGGTWVVVPICSEY